VKRAGYGHARIIGMQPDDLENLVSWRMPFGKYAGTLLADLPGNYLHWFALGGFAGGELTVC